MKWQDALRKWNAGQPSWCIPRRGSKGHKEVLSMMKGNNAVARTTKTAAGTKGQQTYGTAVSEIERKAAIKQRLGKLKKALRELY
jgi:hypothetical protein